TPPPAPSLSLPAALPISRIRVGVAAVLVVEQRAHAYQRVRGPHHPGEAAVDGAAAGLVQAAREHHGHRRITAHFGGQRQYLGKRSEEHTSELSHVKISYA